MAKAKVVFDFECGGPGELTICTNEVLTLLRQDIGDGWYEAKNSRGEQGLVPEAYLEIISAPEPSYPPPPPPTAPARSSWKPPEPSAPPPMSNRISAPPINLPKPSHVPPPVFGSADSWDQPAPIAPNHVPPPSSSWNKTEHKPTQKQESYDDWDDDDWDDDDDSVVSGDTDYQGGLGGAQRRDKSGGTVRKPLAGRFSGFNKQFVDGYLFDLSNPVLSPGEKKIVIREAVNGPCYTDLTENYTCTITSPKKETKFHGMKSFIVYQITPTFSGIQVSRRYKHFDWLHDRMVEKFPTVAVPPLPEKQIAGRFEDDFISVRQKGLQLWMDRMCKHPIIAECDVFQHFLSCTDEKRWKMGKRGAEKNQYQQGKLFLTVEAPVARLDPQTTDDKLEKFSKFVKVMDDSIKHILSVGENNCKKHETTFKKEFKRVGGSLVALSKSFEYDDRPEHQNLTRAMEHTGQTYEEIGQMYYDQPRNDMQYILEGASEYKGVLGVFPDVMSVHKGFTSKIQENAGKFSESEVQSIQSRADVATYTILAEMNHFQQDRVKDFKKYMQEYLKGQITFYQQITQKLQDTLSQYDQA